MLKHLTIRNYALVEHLEADFSSGLVIVTGETGSGKSIIIDALGLILGDRAGAEVVRKGADKAVIEATFQTAGNKKLAQLLAEEGLEGGEELIVRRELSAKGQSRCFAADSPVTLGVQKRIGELLVDLCWRWSGNSANSGSANASLPRRRSSMNFKWPRLTPSPLWLAKKKTWPQS
jgi:DNA repair protein RecN (Recombination protein N)